MYVTMCAIFCKFYTRFKACSYCAIHATAHSAQLSFVLSPAELFECGPSCISGMSLEIMNSAKYEIKRGTVRLAWLPV